jgi:dihydrofolate reductase
MAKLSLIVVYARNGVIGRDNAIPWRIPEDVAHFKRTTMGYPVIMGRKTWDSIGKPLPGRRNIVVTRNAGWHADGAEVARSVDEAIEMCGDVSDIFVVGGAQIYADALPLADVVIATEIDRDVDGDTRFPALDRAAWIESSREEHRSTGPDALPFAFVHYARPKPAG